MIIPQDIEELITVLKENSEDTETCTKEERRIAKRAARVIRNLYEDE